MQNPCNAEKVKQEKMLKMILLGQKALFLAFFSKTWAEKYRSAMSPIINGAAMAPMDCVRKQPLSGCQLY